mmetsp:Transcript_51046/g.119422  ORF Transcript_51046/g.119422 Transcript_51046/m.119422 type:complete len:711 (+) Transcript_51046:56-2188(+)
MALVEATDQTERSSEAELEEDLQVAKPQAAQHNVIPWQFPACHAGLFSGPKESLQVNNDQVCSGCGYRFYTAARYCRRCGKPRTGRVGGLISEVLCAPIRGSRGAPTNGENHEVAAVSTPTCTPFGRGTKPLSKNVPNEDLLAMLGEIANGTTERADDDVSTSPSALALTTGGTPSTGSPAVGLSQSLAKGSPEPGSGQLEEEFAISSLGGDELRNEVLVLSQQVAYNAEAQESLKTRLESELHELQERSTKQQEDKDSLISRLRVVKDTLAKHLKEAAEVESKLLKELNSEKNGNAQLEDQVAAVVNEIRAKEAALRLELQRVTEGQEPMVNDLSKALSAQAETQAQLQAERSTTWRRSTQIMIAFATGASTIDFDDEVKQLIEAPPELLSEGKTVEELEREETDGVAPAFSAPGADAMLDTGASETPQIWRGLSGRLLAPLLRRLRTGSVASPPDEMACFPASTAVEEAFADAMSVASLHAESVGEPNPVLDTQEEIRPPMDEEQWLISQKNCELSKDLALEEASLSQLQAMLEDAAARAATCDVKLDPSSQPEAMQLYSEQGGSKDAGIDAAKSVAHTQALSRALRDAQERRASDANDIQQARESINSKKAEMQDKRQEITDVRSDVIRRTTTYQDTLAQEASLKEQLEAEEKEIKNIYESLKRDIMAKQQELDHQRKETERLRLALDKANSGPFSCFRTSPKSGTK